MENIVTPPPRIVAASAEKKVEKVVGFSQTIQEFYTNASTKVAPLKTYSSSPA